MARGRLSDNLRQAARHPVMAERHEQDKQRAAEAAIVAAQPAEGKPKSERRYPKTRKQLSIYMLPGLTKQVRDACAYISRHTKSPLTMTTFFERAAEAELARLSKQHNRGRAFPVHRGDLPTGPPGRRFQGTSDEPSRA